jgi:hypothetical protein
MTDVLLMVLCVGGAVTLALGVDVGVVIGFAWRRWR